NAGGTPDEDGPVLHPRETSPVGRPDLPPGIAVDADQPPGHLGAHPVRGVAGHLDGAALHVGAQVHAGVAVNGNAAARHAAAGPLDPADIAADLQLLTAWALDLEEVVHTMLPF